jgi:hypothetical protein
MIGLTQMTDDNAELIDALRQLFERQPQVYEEPGVTFEELFGSMGGHGEGTLRRKIKRLCASGVIKAIPTTRPDVAGRASYSVVYRPVIKQESGYNSNDEL